MRKDQTKIRDMINREKKHRRSHDGFIVSNFWNDDDDVYDEVMEEVADHWKRFMIGMDVEPKGDEDEYSE